MDIASTALSAAQTLMDVAGQNIANDATPGYSQQVANLVATPPYAQPDMGGLYTPQLGTGVEVQSVTRVRANYLDGIYRTTQSNESYYSTRTNYLQALQSVLNEPGSNGLSASMNTFFSSYQTLSQNPQSSAARTVVQQDGEALAAQVQQIYQGLQSVGVQAQSQAGLDAQTANSDLQQLANLNTTISQAQAIGQQPNDLLDQRDNLLDSLSKLININFSTQTSTVGSFVTSQVTVTMPTSSGSSVTLVSGGQYGSLQVQPTTTSQASYASDTTALGLTAQTDTINGATIAVTATDTLQSLASKINAANAGVTATVVPNGSQYQLTLTSNSSQPITGNGSDLFGTTAQGLAIPVGTPQFVANATDALTGTTSPVAPSGGSIGAAYSLVNTDLNPNPPSGSAPTLMSQFTSAVLGLLNDINTVQMQGVYPVYSGSSTTPTSWSAGVPFFVSPTNTTGTLTAQDIPSVEVNPAIQNDINQITTTSTQAQDTGGPNLGDGWNATQMADIAQQQSGPVSQYSSFVADMGAAVDLSQNLQSTSQSLLTQVTSQREQTAGVSINEQMTNLVQAQSMYTAAAKVAEAMDSSLQSLLSAIQP